MFIFFSGDTYASPDQARFGAGQTDPQNQDSRFGDFPESPSDQAQTPTQQLPGRDTRPTSRSPASPNIPERFSGLPDPAGRDLNETVVEPDTPDQEGASPDQPIQTDSDQNLAEDMQENQGAENPDLTRVRPETSTRPNNPGRQAEGQRFFDDSPSGEEFIRDKEYLRKVDPENQAAGKFIIVEKNADPGDQDALLSAARRASSAGRYDAALRFYDDLVKKNPDDKVLILERAITLQKLGRYDAALSSYNKVLDKDPGNLEARINMLGLVRERYPSVALQKLIEIYKENPETARLPAQIGLAYAELGNYQDAKRYLEIAISLEPYNPKHAFNLAILEDKKGHHEAALELYEKALELDAVSMSGKKLPRPKIYDRLSILRDRT